MIEIIPIQSFTEERKQQFVRLYEAAFPADERRNTAKEIRKIENSEINLLYFQCEGKFCGFMTLWEFPDFRYVEHFAIDDAVRGKGIGGEILTKLLCESNKDVILEVEPPEDEQSVKRIRFYERHGFKIISKDFTQPPYDPEKSSVLLYILKSGSTVWDEEKLEKSKQLLTTKVYEAL